MIFNFEPIGYLKSDSHHKYDTPRQPGADSQARPGYIELNPGCNFEQALEDLKDMERIWVLFVFDRNTGWKPKVRPPRGDGNKKGVFATRSPHRPNPIGLSCLELLKIKGRRVYFKDSDILNNTPILDIKPYLPWCDAFPESNPGWTAGAFPVYQIHLNLSTSQQVQWLEAQGVRIRSFMINQLTHNPEGSTYKRIRFILDRKWELAYRTWRIEYTIEDNQFLQIQKIASGYSVAELEDINSDPYQDKELHLRFANL
jgi:tRNA-Thr(GGU) m(6)t(6)A37 methyltransferase TsaA